VELKEEDVGVLGGSGRLAEPHGLGEPPVLRGGRLAQGREGPQELDGTRADHGMDYTFTGSTSGGRRYASRSGRTGRRSQYGRLVPSGEYRSAGRVMSSHFR
jgi:hypothetical protein